MSTPRAAGVREALLVWAMLLVDAALVVVTYTRLPPDQLYHTSVSGLRGGLGRAGVSLNFPVAPVAVGLLAVAANALLDSHRRLVVAAAAIAVPMCLLTPLAVHQRDLDFAPINVVPALGVAIVAALTALAVRVEGAPPTAGARGDPLRVALAAGLVLVAVPWLFALLGFYAPDPVYANELPPGGTERAVHLGHHHGLDGVFFALSALALSRALPCFRHRRLTAAASLFLALMLAYGLANALQDFTVEQLWKRGTIGWKPPSVLYPGLTWGWLAVLGATVLIELVWFRRERRR